MSDNDLTLQEMSLRLREHTNITCFDEGVGLTPFIDALAREHAVKLGPLCCGRRLSMRIGRRTTERALEVKMSCSVCHRFVAMVTTCDMAITRRPELLAVQVYLKLWDAFEARSCSASLSKPPPLPEFYDEVVYRKWSRRAQAEMAQRERVMDSGIKARRRGPGSSLADSTNALVEACESAFETLSGPGEIMGRTRDGRPFLFIDYGELSAGESEAGGGGREDDSLLSDPEPVLDPELPHCMGQLCRELIRPPENQSAQDNNAPESIPAIQNWDADGESGETLTPHEEWLEECCDVLTEVLGIDVPSDSEWESAPTLRSACEFAKTWAGKDIRPAEVKERTAQLLADRYPQLELTKALSARWRRVRTLSGMLRTGWEVVRKMEVLR